MTRTDKLPSRRLPNLSPQSLFKRRRTSLVRYRCAEGRFVSHFSTVRKQPGSLPAFRTSGFRKDAQASIKKPPSSAPAEANPAVVEIPSDDDAPPRRARLPVKRMSSDSAYDPESSSPSKRPKLDSHTEKENQSLSTSGKGKARALPTVALEPPPPRDPPLSPRRRIVNGADRFQSPVSASTAKPLPPLDIGANEWPDLDLVSPSPFP